MGSTETHHLGYVEVYCGYTTAAPCYTTWCAGYRWPDAKGRAVLDAMGLMSYSSLKFDKKSIKKTKRIRSSLRDRRSVEERLLVVVTSSRMPSSCRSEPRRIPSGMSCFRYAQSRLGISVVIPCKDTASFRSHDQTIEYRPEGSPSA